VLHFKKFHNIHFLVVGRAGLDLYADTPGTKIEDAKGFTAALGGSAANIAVAICKQGGKASLLTAVSNDAVGRYVVKALGDYGVDVSHVKTVGGEARNSLAVVETRLENCQSVIYRNGAADFQLQENDVTDIAYSNYAAVIVTGTALAVEPSRSAVFKAMDLAKAAGVPLIIDVDYRPYSWNNHAEATRICREAVEMCDIIVGNDEEFAVLAGHADGLGLARALAQKPDRLVVYKQGPKGCITLTASAEFFTPVFSVKALKPTGAGDGFMGGLISGLTRHETIADAVKRGAATAAIIVTRVGCAPATPNAIEVEAFMQTAKHVS
jgi:5-dehydro-2-deoxygluconokinase